MSLLKKRESNVSITKNRRRSIFCNSKSNKFRHRQRGITFIKFLIILSIVILLYSVFVLLPNYNRAGSSGKFTQCQANCKNISTALEMYAEDNEGVFPTRLSQLIPKYLESIPKCASAGKDTYSLNYRYSVTPDSFTFYCTGHNHKLVGVEPNYPQYNSRDGLIVRQ